MALSGLLFAWYRQARQQRNAIEELLRGNASVEAYYQHQVDSQGKLDRGAQPPAPRWLTNATGADYVASITVVEMLYATDADLAQVARLPRLERLTLVRAVDVTDQGIAQLAALKQLRVLRLYDADMLTDQALELLARMPSLERVRFGPLPRHMTSAAVERLRRALPRCRVEVTDEEGDERQLLSHGPVS